MPSKDFHVVSTLLEECSARHADTNAPLNKEAADHRGLAAYLYIILYYIM